MYEGGGLYNHLGAPRLVNCIVWSNTAPTGPQLFENGNTSAISYSDVQGGFAGTANLNVDPLFVRPAGPVQIASGDHHLRFGSPVIDHGRTPSVTVATDLDGNPRVAGLSAPLVDMGA